MTRNDGNPSLLRQLFLHPLVLGVLALKLAAAAAFAGGPLVHWFAPFVGHFVGSGFQDPWAAFWQTAPKAFPYPPGMLYLFAAPLWLLQLLLGSGGEPAGPLQLLAMRLPLLAADALIFAVLGVWFRDRLATVRLWWWCSPVVFYVCYVHGQLDLVPTALFLGALYLLERRRHAAAFLVYGLALATKSHLWIALPFLLVYLRGRLHWSRLLALSALAAGLALLLSLPYLLRPAYQAMVLEAEEQGWVFALGLPLGKFGVSVLLCPAALLFLLVRFAAYPRQNWDLTLLFLGLAFSAFVLLVPPMPGWYLWCLPFFIYYACRFRQSPNLLLLAFSAAYLAYFALGSRSDLAEALSRLAPGFSWPASTAAWLGPALSPRVNDLYFTFLQASLGAAMLLMFTRGVRSNDVYTARRHPLMIGIAGDSGAGKDTLAAAMARLFGEQDTLRLAGDDYHRWERGDANWRQRTHLDPRSNRLHAQLEHAVALKGGQSIVKSEYDHSTGRFTAARELDPRKNVIVQGLHSFLLEGMRKAFDLKVFLDPDEGLRRFWKLQRDASQRGAARAQVLAAERRREADRRASIRPQREHADLVFSLQPADARQLRRFEAEPELWLEILARNTYDLESLAGALAGLSGMQVSVDYPAGLAHVRLRIRGPRLMKSEIDRLALALVPNLLDLVGTQPEFQDGWEGLMSLAVLVCLGAELRMRAVEAGRGAV